MPKMMKIPTAGYFALIRSDGTAIGSYNQSGSFPNSLGHSIVNFLRCCKPSDFDEMVTMIEKLKPVKHDAKPSDQAVKYYTHHKMHICQTDAYFLLNKPPPDPSLSWENLLRRLTIACEALVYTRIGVLRHLIDISAVYERDKSWCDFTYFLDFGKRTLEIREGKDIGKEEQSDVGEENVHIMSFDMLLADPDWICRYGRELGYPNMDGPIDAPFY